MIKPGGYYKMKHTSAHHYCCGLEEYEGCTVRVLFEYTGLEAEAVLVGETKWACRSLCMCVNKPNAYHGRRTRYGDFDFWVLQECLVPL